MGYAISALIAVLVGFSTAAALRKAFSDGEAEEYGLMGAVMRRQAKVRRDGKGKTPAKALADAVGRIVPLAKRDADAYRERLLRAGIRWNPDTWHGMEIAVTAAFALLGAMAGSSFTGAMPTAAGAVVGGVVGWSLPRAYLTAAAKSRRAKIEAALPDMLDLLAINVSAGSTLAKGVKQVAAKCTGPLAEEFAQVDRDVNMFNLGMDRAIERMAARCGSPSVQVLCAAIVQSVRSGANIEPTLKNQAEIARRMQHDAMAEKIGKLAVKATPVLVLFVLATLIAVGAPMIAQLASNLGSVI